MGVCSILGKSVSMSLCVVRSTDVDTALLVEEGMQLMLDGGMSSKSSIDPFAFREGSRGRRAKGFPVLFLLGVAVTCTL